MSTNVITSTDLRDNLADALDSVTKTKVLIVKRRGKSEKAIVDIDMFEDLLASSNKQYLKSIKKARQEAKKGELFTFDEVFGNL